MGKQGRKKGSHKKGVRFANLVCAYCHKDFQLLKHIYSFRSMRIGPDGTPIGWMNLVCSGSCSSTINHQRRAAKVPATETEAEHWDRLLKAEGLTMNAGDRGWLSYGYEPTW